jgi:hypothetical protein
MRGDFKADDWLSAARVFRRAASGHLLTQAGKLSRQIVPIDVGAVRTDNRRESDGYLRVAHKRDDPTIFLTDEDGQFVDLLADGTYRFQTYLTCLNNPVFVRESLALIKRVMDKGADGVVIRYFRQDQQCHAEGRHIGFVKRKEDIYSEIPWMEQFDPMALNLPTHKHVYPGKDQDYAFEKFIGKAKRLIKSYGLDKVVVLEADRKFSEKADGFFVKSLLSDMDKIGKLRSRVAKPILVATFPWECCEEQDVSFVISMSWLYGFACVLPETVGSRLAGRLSKIDRGERRSDVLPLGVASGVLYENGVAVVNPSGSEAVVRLELPKDYPCQNLIDVCTGQPAKVDSGTTITKSSVHDQAHQKRGFDLVARVPARSGKCYYAQHR